MSQIGEPLRREVYEPEVLPLPIAVPATPVEAEPVPVGTEEEV